jgi:hypothetical protein
MRRLAFDVQVNNEGGRQKDSILEVWSRTTYLDAVRRYEAARNADNRQASQAALADVIRLQRTQGCNEQVNELIALFLRGQRQGFQPSQLEITLAVQEVNRNQFDARTRCNEHFLGVLNGSTPAAIRENLTRLHTDNIQAMLPVERLGCINKLAAARQLELALRALPAGQAPTAAAMRELILSLTEINRAFVWRNESQWNDLVDSLNSDRAETRARKDVPKQRNNWRQSTRLLPR